MKPKTFTRQIPCSIPYPDCNPDGCRNCQGRGFTLKEVPDTWWHRFWAWVG